MSQNNMAQLKYIILGLFTICSLQANAQFGEQFQGQETINPISFSSDVSQVNDSIYTIKNKHNKIYKDAYSRQKKTHLFYLA